MDETVIDTRGLNCPLPVLRAAKTLRGLDGGAMLRLLATDPNAVQDVAAFCEARGHELCQSVQRDDEYHFLIRKAGKANSAIR